MHTSTSPGKGGNCRFGFSVPQMLRCMCRSLQPVACRGTQVPLFHPLPLPPFPPLSPLSRMRLATGGLRLVAVAVSAAPLFPTMCCGREGCQVQLQWASILQVSEFSRRSSRRQRAVERSVERSATLPGGPGRFTASASLLLLLSRCRPSASPRGRLEVARIQVFSVPEPRRTRCPVTSQHHTHLKPATHRSAHLPHQLLAPQKRRGSGFVLNAVGLGLKRPRITSHATSSRLGCMRGTVAGLAWLCTAKRRVVFLL